MPRHMVSNRHQIPFAAAVPCLLSLYCLIRPSFSSPLLFIPLLGGSQDHIEEVVRTRLESMEGGKKPSSSIADELFPTGKYAPPPSSTNFSSSSPGYFSSVFPPASSVLGKSQGNPSKTQTVRSKDVKSVSPSRSEESAYFGSSVHYGGRDFYDSSASNQASGAPKPIKDLDKGENSNDPNAANRGEWWQGSLYY